MSGTSGTTGTSSTTPTQEELQTQIEEQRAELADTLDQLARKLDVKAQARSRLERVGPRQIAAVVGGVLALGALVWWRRGR
jgi:uncharacterized protein YllA (UPF0747 family)